MNVLHRVLLNKSTASQDPGENRAHNFLHLAGSVATVLSSLFLFTGYINSSNGELDSFGFQTTSSSFHTTNFPLTENPISEGGKWTNGKTNGVDWQDVRTTPGLAFFTVPNVCCYDDSTAILTGTWGPDQYVRGKVRIPTSDPNYPQEIEIRLRSTISSKSSTGYEILGGTQIVRWNGPIGSFTVLPDQGPYGTLRDGDVFEASIVGNVITVYINGVQVNRAVDSTFSTGNPGMGFFTRNPAPSPFGFSSFTASNTPISSQLSPPTNLRIIN